MGICCMAQETQKGALYQPRGVGQGGKWEGSLPQSLVSQIHWPVVGQAVQAWIGNRVGASLVAEHGL